MYPCEKCSKSFSNNFELRRHMNRKTSCENQIMINGVISCDRCSKEFKSYRGLKYHVSQNVCNSKESITTQNIQNIDKQVNNTQNNNMNVDGDVKLVKFGNENLSYISDDLFKSILGRGFKCVEELVDHSHFHPDHPENYNIYIANIKNDYVVIYDGKKWNINKKEDVFEDIIYAKSDFLCLKFKELMGQMTETDIKKFTNFINQRDEDQTMNKIKGELKLQLYNNRELPQKLRKHLEAQDREKQKQLGNKPRKNTKKLEKIMFLLENMDDSKLSKMEDMLNTL